MAALATYADCQTRWGTTLSAGEITQVNALLIDASALVLEVADLTTDWTSATLPATVLPVVCEVVRRAFDNPSGLQGETIGDYTWRGGGGTSPGMYLTPTEKRTVRRAAGKLGVGTASLEGDLPLTVLDPRYLPAGGILIVNAAEPADS